MRRRLAGAIVAVGLMIGVATWRSGHVRGAVQAPIDFFRGRTTFYALGCVSGPPSGLVAFREWEILGNDYGVRFETIGGIGPSSFQVNFVRTYDPIMLWLFERRYGSDILSRVEQRARADIHTRDVQIVGTYRAQFHELVVSPDLCYRVEGAPELLEGSSFLDGQKVRVTGATREVQDSKWNDWGRPSIQASQIQAK